MLRDKFQYLSHCNLRNVYSANNIYPDVLQLSDDISFVDSVAMQNNPLLWYAWINVCKGLILSELIVVFTFVERSQESSSPQAELVRSILGFNQHTAIHIPFLAPSLLLCCWKEFVFGAFGKWITISYLPSLPALQINTDLYVKKSINITAVLSLRLSVL